MNRAPDFMLDASREAAILRSVARRAQRRYAVQRVLRWGLPVAVMLPLMMLRVSGSFGGGGTWATPGASPSAGDNTPHETVVGRNDAGDATGPYATLAEASGWRGAALDGGLVRD